MNLTENSNDNIALVKKLSYDLYPNNKVLAELTIVQAILEGGLRNSPPSLLAYKYNNLFGIKGKGTNGFINLATREFIHGQWVHVDPKNQVYGINSFAWNDSVEDSLKQHELFLEHSRYVNVVKAKTFDDAAYQIWKAGYATDPHYPALLKDLHNEYFGD